mmetsp:Transcript_102959/g.290848  ORF Transcript_102959/g.290848 Transcript_102959/m.290848 type:complete len:223 (+) Transcript_102959:160-828(+)
MFRALCSKASCKRLARSLAAAASTILRSIASCKLRARASAAAVSRLLCSSASCRHRTRSVAVEVSSKLCSSDLFNVDASFLLCNASTARSDIRFSRSETARGLLVTADIRVSSSFSVEAPPPEGQGASWAHDVPEPVTSMDCARLLGMSVPAFVHVHPNVVVSDVSDGSEGSPGGSNATAYCTDAFGTTVPRRSGAASDRMVLAPGSVGPTESGGAARGGFA